MNTFKFFEGMFNYESIDFEPLRLLTSIFAQNLIDSLGFDHKADKGMTLTEIYNLSEIEYKSEEKSKPTIGFNRY